MSVITYFGGLRGRRPIWKSFRLKSLPQPKNACSITFLNHIIRNRHYSPYLGLNRHRSDVFARQSESLPQLIYLFTIGITRLVRRCAAKYSAYYRSHLRNRRPNTRVDNGFFCQRWSMFGYIGSLCQRAAKNFSTSCERRNGSATGFRGMTISYPRKRPQRRKHASCAICSRRSRYK